MILFLAFCFLDRYRSSQVHSRVACPRLSDSGENAKENAREKLARREKVSSRFIFVFALSQFSGLSRSNLRSGSIFVSL